MATASTRLPEKFHPPKTFRLVIGKLASLNCLTDLTYRFPKRKFGKTERSFRAEWCEDYPWLHYDVKLDTAFCYLP